MWICHNTSSKRQREMRYALVSIPLSMCVC
nr:MAG TPA: hypothetical protein [Caudoviricetes sp.]